MAATVDEISMDYEEDGVLVVKTLSKEVLTKGAWATVMFEYQEFDKKKAQQGSANDDCYGPVKFSIRRYQKRNGAFMQKSKFNISSRDQAQKIINTLEKWLADREED